MNILINCLSSVSGGAVSYLGNILPLLVNIADHSSAGIDIKILAHISQQYIVSGLPPERCILLGGTRPTGLRRLLWEKLNLQRILRKHNIDILFTPHQASPRFDGVKNVMMIRNMEPFCLDTCRYKPLTKIRKQVFAAVCKNSLRHADRIIAVSDYTKDFLTSRLMIPPARIRRIYHGRDESFTPAGSTSSGQTFRSTYDQTILSQMGLSGDYIFTIGSLLPYRKCEDVIHAFDLITKPRPSPDESTYAQNNTHSNTCNTTHNPSAQNLPKDIKLVIAGIHTDPAYTKYIRQTIAHSLNPDRIILTGHVPLDTIKILYRNCIACIIASQIEACPNIVIEAMSSGSAIIAADNPPLPELLAGSALLYQPGNITSLASQLARCLENDFVRKSLLKRALRRSRDFSWPVCAEMTFSALTDWQPDARFAAPSQPKNNVESESKICTSNR